MTPIDPLTIAETLRTQGDLESVGDRPYLHAIVSMVPTTANALKYAEIVSKLATLRRLIEAANRIAAIGYNIPDDLDEALDEAENLIYQISNKDRDERVKDWKTLLEDTYDEMEALGTHAQGGLLHQDRFQGPGPEDPGAAPLRPHRHRGPALHGQDQPGPEHRGQRGHQRQASRWSSSAWR